jgi:hemoglobin
MPQPSPLLTEMGGEAACRRLSAAFYLRVARDPVLKPLFPGKSLRCATEEFAAFLIQFLGGDEGQTQFRWRLSLRESHARFPIGPAERAAWLKLMRATLDDSALDPNACAALFDFFEHSSRYIAGRETDPPAHPELSTRWADQRALDDACAAIAEARDQDALRLAPQFLARPAVFVGLLARMVEAGRADLVAFTLHALQRDPSLATRQSGGRALLHYAAGAGCLPVVTAILRLGGDADLRDTGGHTPLYRVANQCASPDGPAVVRALLQSGAAVNARNGVTQATALHMAARRGFLEIAQALLDAGADFEARDRKGDTPLRRARNCRKTEVAELLAKRRRQSEPRP